LFSYRKLLQYLHNIDFRYSIPKDRNRAEDGIVLRYRFIDEYVTVECPKLNLNEPCSVLEMMVALAIRCEESIMDDPTIGDRTGQWFWGMIKNLGLATMKDEKFDSEYVYDVITRFLDREYEPDGRGGLFTVKNCEYDLRTVEIWYQLCYYLDTII
jgi:hypothetical protein